MPFVSFANLLGNVMIVMPNEVFLAYLFLLPVGLGLGVPWLAHLPQPTPDRAGWNAHRVQYRRTGRP